MEAMEYLIYTLLFLVLIAFIGVIGYIIYDNYTYKNNLTSDLNTNFIDINQNFNSTSNIISQLHDKHTSNYFVLDGKLDNTSNVLHGKIDYTSNILDRRILDTNDVFNQSINDVNSRNTISDTRFTSNFDTFGYNMNKYFTFNNTDAANAFNQTTNKKIFEYRTVATDTNSRLDLITKTTATAGLKISSDSNNAFEVCNKTGTNCFNMFGNDNDLYIYGTSENQMNRNIYIGSSDKTNAPISIENNIVKINNVNISTLRTDANTLRTDANTLRTDVDALRVKIEQSQPPVSQPPVSQPPVSQPPVSQPPVSQLPVSQPPVTQPPVSQPPVTQPPVSQPPVSQPPVTQPPVTQPPVSQPQPPASGIQ
jgi:hypothetical protein